MATNTANTLNCLFKTFDRGSSVFAAQSQVKEMSYLFLLLLKGRKEKIFGDIRNLPLAIQPLSGRAGDC